MDRRMRTYKEMTISCSHQLDLPYESACNRLHGHNCRIEVWVDGEVDEHGMVADFTHVKEVVGRYDHRHLNDFFTPATAENFVNRLLADLKARLPTARHFKVRVWETPTCYAEGEA